MELSNAQHQEMGTDSLENMLICTKAQQEMRKPRPQQEQALKCPRCDSTNTKFCYYNNYSLTQPRYFCKSCRRYWTNGGTLRNVPVGGSCRKNKRPSSSSSSKRSISVNSDTHNQQQLLPHHHPHQPHLLNSSSDTLQSPFSAFSSHMSSYDNEYPTTDLSHVFPRLLQKQSCGYESEYDHHQQHNHTLEHNLSLLGNYSANNTHFGNIMGLNNAAAATRNNNNNISGHGFLEGLKANLLNNNTASSTNFHNLYNGFANNNNSSVSNINGDQIMIPYENLSSNFGSKTSALKQEDHQLNDNNRSSQVFWGAAAAGFPWHQISSHNNNIGGVHGDNNNNNMVNDIDLVRENINVFAAPVWHGLINSPLM